MKKLVCLLLLVVFPISSVASEKSCRTGLKTVSCKGVKKSLRKQFCWKGKISQEKQAKICRSVAKKKRHPSKVKKAS